MSPCFVQCFCQPEPPGLTPLFFAAFSALKLKIMGFNFRGLSSGRHPKTAVLSCLFVPAILASFFFGGGWKRQGFGPVLRSWVAMFKFSLLPNLRRIFGDDALAPCVLEKPAGSDRRSHRFPRHRLPASHPFDPLISPLPGKSPQTPGPFGRSAFSIGPLSAAFLEPLARSPILFLREKTLSHGRS